MCVKNIKSILLRAEFYAKSRILMLLRATKNATKRAPLHTKRQNIEKGEIIAQISSTLFTKIDPGQEELRNGKIANLSLCAQKLDGVFIPKGQVFSFWRQIGRPTLRNGFVKGREIRNGVLIPSVGGGICQLSSSLYQLAKQAGFEIVERHTHTKVFEGAAFPAGEDANVFWNYIDFRFRAGFDVFLSVEVSETELMAKLYQALAKNS